MFLCCAQNILWSIALLVLLFVAPFTPSQATTLDTESLFRDVKNSLVQIKISNIHSGEKSSIGSGFFIAKSGELITNYHVVSSVVREPDDYRIELLLHDGTMHPATVVNFDLIHDLALLHTTASPRLALDFFPGEMAKGTEIASIGNPHDLGMTVVRGSYSGYVENSLYERMHFTGAINPGMSGGPALNGQAQVVGVNVATAGNEVGFLVPGKFARALYQHSKSSAQPLDASKAIQRQLQHNQEHISRDIFAENFPQTELGNYLVPNRLTRQMKCWGNSMRDKEKPYQVTSKQCSTEDEIYIDRSYSTGSITLEHKLISSQQLSPHRFAKLYQRYFNNTPAIHGSKEDLTNFECNTEFVDTGKLQMKLALCLRRHREFSGLYDLLLKGATIGEERDGVQTTLLITGINYSNAMAVAKRYVGTFAWKE